MSLGKQRIIILLLLGIFLAGWSAVHAAVMNGVTIESEGVSTIVNGNNDRARELAILDAKRRAVEEVVGAFIDSRTDVNNYQVIRDTISASSSGFVATYEILSESAKNGVYKVSIKAVVKKDAIRQKVDELKNTIKAAGKPRVMVIVEGPLECQVIQTGLTKGLMNVGFPVVDETQVQEARDIYTNQKILSADPKLYHQLASKYDAEIILIGKASAETISEYQGLISCRGFLDIKAVKSATGQTIASSSFNEIGVDIAESSAGRKAFLKVSEKALAYFKSELGNQLIDENRSVQIILTGITYSDLKVFEQHLKNTAFVKNVYLRDFSNGTAKVDVETALLADQLVDQITGWFDFPLEVTTLSGNKIELKK